MSIELLNIDCMDYMKDLPDNAFEIMAKFDSYNVIKRELDRCMDFRMAFKD
jgi:hypothetical protein